MWIPGPCSHAEHPLPALAGFTGMDVMHGGIEASAFHVDVAELVYALV